MPGVMTFPNCGSNVLTYLLVLAAAGGALVEALVVSLPLWLQPANTPTRPNSAIRVSNLFIVGITLTILEHRTSKNLPYLHEP
jgi:hypothetical protein